MSVFIGYPSFMAYQMMKGKKGNNDGFPSIPGMIARYSALGLTNEQMKENPVWVDKTGNGHDLQMKNFAWSGMSGVGGYVENYNRWTKSAVRADITFTDHSFNVTSVKINQAQFYYQSSGGEQPFTVPSGTVIVKGLTDGQVLEYIYTDIEGRHVFTVKNDGIYTLPSFEFIAKGAYYGFQFNKVQESCNITIEQLPLYPGALVFDGVDDYGTCDNFPILTKGKGYTVVALRSYLAKSIGYLVYNGTSAKQSAFAFERSDSLDTWSWGKNSSIRNLLPKLMSYQTSNSYNNNPISTGEVVESNNIINVAYGGGYCNVAIWEIVILDHDATEEELTKIKDYFVKTYPWLFPDQAWTVVGKTNEDEDRATIANITGNGNDLVLSNFGFAEGSGYNEEGEYAGYLVTDGVDDKAVSKQFKFGENFTVILDFKFPVKKISYCGFDLSSKVRIQNLQGSGVNVVLKGNKTLIPSNVVRAVTSDGKVYDENWNEYNIVPGNISSNYTMVNLGFDGSNQFAEFATKLAGIYSSALSKDDCIKAYNYLQTLKAK